jgi:hypothetical protein
LSKRERGVQEELTADDGRADEAAPSFPPAGHDGDGRKHHAGGYDDPIVRCAATT